jgi:hypothetical protein
VTPNPLKTIWFLPRPTIRLIVESKPDFLVLLFACLLGIGRVLDRAVRRHLGDQIAVPSILALALLAGLVSGPIMLWLFAFLIRWTGRWIGGLGNLAHIRAALAWGSVPTAFSLVLWIPQFLLAGSDLFTTATPRLDANPDIAKALVGLSVLQLFAGFWSAFLLSETVAEVQGFASAWRGLANILLSFGVVFAALMTLVAIAISMK